MNENTMNNEAMVTENTELTTVTEDTEVVESEGLTGREVATIGLAGLACGLIGYGLGKGIEFVVKKAKAKKGEGIIAKAKKVVQQMQEQQAQEGTKKEDVVDVEAKDIDNGETNEEANKEETK